MEINPAGVIIAFVLVFVIAFFAAMVVVMILQALNVIRVKRNTDFLLISFGIAVILLVAFWLIKTMPHRSRSSDRVDIVTDTTIPSSIKDTARYN
jgi:hypothetical protein